MAIEHSDAPTGEIHLWHNWAVADATARDALTVAAGDVGKVAWKQDDDSFWVLKDDSPMTWIQLNLVGSLADASVTDAKLATPYIKADGTRAFTGDQSMGSHKLTNVTDPASAQDAATKNYVDALATGFDFKASVRVATTANITLSGAQTIDGVSVIAGDRVLVKNQSTGADNGIYVCAAGAWSRATDADSSTEVTGGMMVPVNEGTSNADTFWILTTNDPITLGSTSLSFTQYGASASPSGAAGGDLSGTYPNPRVSQINDANGNELVKFGTTASAVNEVTITNQATGADPSIAATGGDTDLNLSLSGKGAGRVKAADLEVSESLRWSGDLSPSQITSNQNDYSPTNLSDNTILRLDFDSTLRNITGVAGGADGRVLLIGNVGTNYGLIKHADTGSSAANRFVLPGAMDLAVWPDELYIFLYDSTTSRWRLVGLAPSTISPAFETLTDGATITWDFHGRRMRNAKVTLGGNRTLAFSNVPAGATGLLEVVQDGTGSRTLTLPANSKVVGGGSGAITLTTTAGAIDVISFYYDGTNYFWTYGKNFS